MRREFRKLLFLAAVASTLSMGSSFAADTNLTKRVDTMDKETTDRVEMTKERMNTIYKGIKSPFAETDPDFDATFHRFLLGEVQVQGKLTDKEKLLITIASVTAGQKLSVLPIQLEGALNAGATPVEIKEVLYQIAPYTGFPNVLEALAISNKVFKEKGIPLPLENQTTVTEATRFAKGLKVQQDIFGAGNINTMRAKAPANQQHIQDYLSAFCFGDTYTRGALDLKLRELLTLCAIVSIGGCDPQAKAHVQGNVNVGNDKDTLICAVTQCLPYIGFPRTLNGLACINQVIPQ